MDYLKIYNNLIEHRMMLPRLEGVYYERHHILPTCMGGGDEPENLVYLTAEDHFMAHLLLAKAYGGKLWFAANAMCMTKEGQRVIRTRRAFGTIRREAGEERRDNTVYDFRRISTGEVFGMTPREFDEKCATFNSAGQNLAAGRMLTHNGYCLASADVGRKYEQRGSLVITVRNDSTGEVVTGTARRIVQAFKITYWQFTEMLTGFGKTAGYTRIG